MLIMALASGCASRKRKGETGAFGRFYHNMTAKYNGYFNANELLKESITSLEGQHNDNYTKLLEVYPYSATDNPKSVAGDLDKAIEKVTTVATLHEPSHWVDDCYLLMGKAQYLKQDYELAQETFEYFEEEFDPNNPNGRLYDKNKRKKNKEEKKKLGKEQKEDEKKAKEKEREDAKKKREREKDAKKKQKDAKKKEREKAKKDRNKKKRSKVKKTEEKPKVEEKKETAVVSTTPKTTPKKTTTTPEAKKKEKPKAEGGGLFGHRPAFHEGVLWLAKTYTERQNFFSADYLLNKLENEYPVSDEVKRDVDPARAHMLIKQKKYNEAIGALEKAIVSADDKTARARYAYIIGQIHQQNGDYKNALDAFERVDDHKPGFVMEFNAKLNTEKIGWQAGRESKEEVLGRLDKMLGENKYSDHYGQIHYTRGEIYLKSGDKELAIEEFRKALANSENGGVGRVETYYSLATLYYEAEDYVEAKTYYDSTLQVMNKTDERHTKVSVFANSLTDIAKNISIITDQDSLLSVAAMSESDQREYAILVLEKRRASGKKAGKEKKGSRKGTARRSKRPGVFSTFFAYNPAMKKRGETTFQKRWGDRQLEDNWRLSSKASGDLIDDEDLAAVDESTGFSESEINAVIRELPGNGPKAEEANNKIKSALYDLGVLYRDRIQNFKKSIEVLEELQTRYPESEHELDALYYLYLSNVDLNNTSRASHYKNLIATKYPNSEYAKVLTDPDYLKNLMAEEKRLDLFYDNTYESFLDGEYTLVLTRIEDAKTKFGATNDLMPKFDLLGAMCLGNTKGEEDYVTALRDVSTKYPNSPESTRAKEIIRFLKGDAEAFDKTLFEEEGQKFSYEPDKLHYVILVIYEATTARINDAKISISSFNKKYHKLSKLKLTDIYLNVEDKSKVVLIRKFSNAEKAMNYIESVDKNQSDFVDSKKVQYDIYPVSQKNYREIIKMKTSKSYGEYFKANY